MEPSYVPRSTQTAHQLACDVIRILRESNLTLGVAESLTGGGLMAALTAVEGCSDVFRGGAVSYATPLKQHLLDVDGDLILENGVIDGEVAAQMAQGARTSTSRGMRPTSWGVGTTGVAGPDEQEEKPVGTVYIGVANADRRRWFGPFRFPGSRERVREATVIEALSLLKRELQRARGEGVVCRCAC